MSESKRTWQESPTNHQYNLLMKMSDLVIESLEIGAEVAGEDSLTGLRNRRAFDEQMRLSVGQARRAKDPYSLLIIDLDKFKQVNDTQGHPAGDAMLIKAAEVFKEQARESDYIARVGGDEFAIILQGADQEGAQTQAERISVALKEATDSEVTTSIGIATYEGGFDAEQWYGAADSALYEAKETRDTIACYIDTLEQTA